MGRRETETEKDRETERVLISKKMITYNLHSLEVIVEEVFGSKKKGRMLNGERKPPRASIVGRFGYEYSTSNGVRFTIRSGGKMTISCIPVRASHYLKE